VLIVTIDGPAGSGKSTVAKKIAARCGLPFLDTGAMYRAVALYFMENAVEPEETEKIERLMNSISLRFRAERLFLCERDITEAIRLPQISERVSLYASLPGVRKHLVALQRQQAQEPGVVAEGRDMGTVVFPQANFKFFLSASPEERAKRRCRELRQKDPASRISCEEVLKNILERDFLDSNRKESPLRKASDALEIDTTSLSIDEVVEKLVLHMASS